MSATAYQRRRREMKKPKYLPPTRGYGVPINQKQPRSLVEYTVKELRELCKERGLKGYSSKSEVELVEMLLGCFRR